jgi:hypothetical protein
MDQIELPFVAESHDVEHLSELALEQLGQVGGGHIMDGQGGLSNW